MTIRTPAAAAGMLLAAAACETGLSSQSLVTHFRILGIRAEPPHAAEGEPVTVDALLADPMGEGRAVTHVWTACVLGPAGDMDRCRDPAEGGIFAVETGETFEFVAPDVPDGPDAAVVMVTLVACAGGTMTYPPGRPGGGPSLPECQGGDGATAFKRVSVGGEEPRNRNPTIESVMLDGAPLPPGDAGVRLAPCSYGRCPRHALAVTYATGSVETYTVIEFGEERERIEDPYLSWFATGGEFERSRSGGTEPDVEWSQPAGAGTVDLYFVAHDGRGGQDWTVRRITIE